MIYAFNFTCDRDNDLSNLMVHTLCKRCMDLKELVVINTDHNVDYKDYGNGAGWTASMLKLKRLREFQLSDNDFVLSVDSDMVFTSGEVFKYISPEYGIIGIKHRPEFHTHFGQWSHMSGASIYIRGDVAKKMAALSTETLDNIRYQHFKPYRLTENEDVVLSYLARFVGANYFDLGTVPGLSSGNFESDVLMRTFASFYHLNYCPTKFLGEAVTGKWHIPAVLKMKGIEL